MRRPSRRHPSRHPRYPLRRRVVVAVPSGLTFANLFFGVFAIITAARGAFATAGLYVVLGGIADALDGRVARATDTGTRIGAELDSLVDIVTFGLAPAMIMYFSILNREGWEWLLAFVYVAAAAWRLAVFNVQQAGRAKKYFHGLPSPAAGLTLATYYWFSQTSLYNETNIAQLPWHQMFRFIMIGLAALMVSPVPYPAVPTVGFSDWKKIVSTLVVVGTAVSVFLIPRQFFFPACLAYIVFGLGRATVLGLLNRRDTEAGDALPQDELLAEAAEHLREHVRDRHTREHEIIDDSPIVSVASSPRLSVSADKPLPPAGAPQRRRRRRRPPRGRRPNRPDRPENPDIPPSSPQQPPGE